MAGTGGVAMPVLSFQPWKATLVEQGLSRQTVRRERKHPICKGDQLYLWQSQRSSNRRRLGTAICTNKDGITIEQSIIRLCSTAYAPLDDAALLAFVRADGFEDPDQFFKFFQDHYTLPFRGVVLHWGEVTV
ncbi:hypothetical protein H6F43_16035 [Leptolyngbya sp. FACHB-36]|uniref:hypothetical protein n=1 Tax=Leptolyngbya sp. FACHB-36 TaxID=2692808 RepID=UPI0019A5B6A0|nr:hypothetical protein [Leptolyngbya sp. FACHB-36]MBD2021690.1 hypothetical protein [Leptolyngbya sp. FACHB-36]